MPVPRMKDRKPNKERAAAFAAARAAAGFTSAAISAFGTRCKNEAKWNDGRTRTDARVGAHECQRIAQQAFSALDMYAFGKRGRPRFKGKGRPLHSLQGKSADSGKAAPAAQRPLARTRLGAPHEVCPYRLAPGQRQTTLVRAIGAGRLLAAEISHGQRCNGGS